MKYGKMIEIVFAHGTAKINIKKFCKERPFRHFQSLYRIFLRDAFNHDEICSEILEEINSLIAECEVNYNSKKHIIKRCNEIKKLLVEGE